MKVLIVDKFEKSGLLELEALGCELSLQPEASGEALVAAAGASQCQVIIVRSTKVTRQVMEAARQLELIVRAGAGVDNIDVVEATNRGIAVCNCPGKNAVAVAELTMGLILVGRPDSL
jgi:D-3-phosphoglycerate dehydrogenase